MEKYSQPKLHYRSEYAVCKARAGTFSRNNLKLETFFVFFFYMSLMTILRRDVTFNKINVKVNKSLKRDVICLNYKN